MSKSFLIYGENWEGTLPRLLYDHLIEMTLPVKIFDYTNYLPGIKSRDLPSRIKRRLFYSIYKESIQVRLLECISDYNPSCLIVCKGLELSTSTLQAIKALGIYLVNWNPDDFFNPKNSNKNLLDSMSSYDLIVSSRPHLFSRYQAAGAHNLLYIDWYYIPSIHCPPHSPSVNRPASFVGSWSPYREYVIQQLPIRFDIYGACWNRSSMEFKKLHNVNNIILDQKSMAHIFASSRFNLNILTKENSDLTNLRLFEVTASGGLLVTERNDATKAYLDDGSECLMYSDIQELRSILSDTNQCNSIASAGHYRITNSGNTFAHRVTQLLQHILP